MKIVWIDGTFGVGKSTVSYEITKRINNAHVLEFDALQDKYKPKSFSDVLGERYPEARRYLIDALIYEIEELSQKKCINYLIIPIALINDYCNKELINYFQYDDCLHIILTASYEPLRERILSQTNRDVDLALTYMQAAINYLETHYPNAVRIDTSHINISEVTDQLVEIILQN